MVQRYAHVNADHLAQSVLRIGAEPAGGAAPALSKSKDKTGMSRERTSAVMQTLAGTVDAFLNGDDRGTIVDRKIGFALLVFPFDGPQGARTNWVSNAERAGMLIALKEIVARFEGQAEQRGTA